MIETVRRRSRPWLLIVLAVALLLAPLTSHAQRSGSAPPVTTPESAGMSTARLARLAAVFSKEIEDRKLPGAVMMVARKGKVVYVNALGVRDPKTADPMRPDTIFRIYSMTGTAIRLIDVSKQPGNDSGGAGGVGTAGDYLRFCQMLANGGILDGQRVLSRTTVRLMTSDHLGSRIAIAPTPGGGVLGASTYTFGLGFAVRPADGVAPVPGTAGDFNWGGYAGTRFWVDPKEQLVGVFMVQSAGALRAYHRELFRQLVYQAIVD